MSNPIEGITLNGVEIENTFAEAFAMKATRIIITAINYKWAHYAANSMVGFATSVIGCGAEAGIERQYKPAETPDGRPGVSVLLFAMSTKDLSAQLTRRVAQCVLTCPTSAVFAGIEGDEKIALGHYVRYFGDGYQTAKLISDKRYWRIPVMDGEFLCEAHSAAVPAVGGGNFLIFAHSASTHEQYCPTLKGIVQTKLRSDTAAVMEIVIDALDVQDIIDAMRAGILAVCELGLSEGITTITAGNYGGQLGKYQFHLWEIVGA